MKLALLVVLACFVALPAFSAPKTSPGDWILYDFETPPWGFKGTVLDEILDFKDGKFLHRATLSVNGQKRVSEKWEAPSEFYTSDNVDKILKNCVAKKGKIVNYKISEMETTIQACHLVLGQQTFTMSQIFSDSFLGEFLSDLVADLPGEGINVWIGHVPVYGMLQQQEIQQGALLSQTKIKKFFFKNP